MLTVIFWFIGSAIGQTTWLPFGLAFDPEGKRLAISDKQGGQIVLFTMIKGRGGALLWRSRGTFGVGILTKPGRLTWLDGRTLAVCDLGQRAVVLFKWDRRGWGVGQRLMPEVLRQPTGIWALRGWLFVADAEAHCVHLFRRGEGGWQYFGHFGKAGQGEGELKRPADIVATSDGLLFVADEGNGRVVIWRFDLRTGKARPHDPYALKGFWGCWGVALSRGALWALSAYSGEIKRLQLSRGTFVKPRWFIFSGFLWGDQKAVTAVHSGHRTPDGKPSRHSLFAGGHVPSVFALGRLGTPTNPVRDFDVTESSPSSWVAVASGREVLLVPADFRLPTRPRISPGRTDALVAWETPVPTESLVEVRPSSRFPDLKARRGTRWQRFFIPGKRTRHRVLVRGLRPGMAYRLRIPLTRCQKIFGPEKSVADPMSFEFAFATDPPKGKTAFFRIPVAVLVYADVINADTLTPDAPPPPPVPRSYLDYLRREVEVAQRFFWVNSHMKLWIDCDWFIVTKRIWVGKKKRGLKDWRRDLTALLKLKGRELTEYPAVVVITCERRWDRRQKRYGFAPSGGGTYGADMRPGSSHFLGGSDIAWLFVHEFHHQLDSQFAESGYPEYPFNHFSVTPEGFADAFGEHYDGNAWILRHWHGGDLSLWFANKFGDLVLSDDSDEDGVPDDCPLVPLDEARFGSEPKERDTDGDGLSDLEEALKSSWVFELLPSVSNAKCRYLLPDPTNPDTDGDGIDDGSDPLPLYPCRLSIPRKERFWLRAEEDTRDVLTPYGVARPSRPLRADLFWSHNGHQLQFRFVFNRPVATVHLQFDGNADGYYVGADNLDVRITPDWEKGVAKIIATVTNAASKTRWPFPDKTLYAEDKVRVAVKRCCHRYELIIGLEAEGAIGLTFRSGKVFGLAINFRVTPHSDRWLSVFEPYRLIPVKVR